MQHWEAGHIELMAKIIWKYISILKQKIVVITLQICICSWPILKKKESVIEIEKDIIRMIGKKTRETY